MLVTQKADDIMHVADRSKLKSQHFHLSIVKDASIGKKCLSVDIFKPINLSEFERYIDDEIITKLLNFINVTNQKFFTPLYYFLPSLKMKGN